MRKSPVLSIAAALIFAPVGSGALAAAVPPAGGTISIEPKTANGDYDSSMRSFVAAASDALATKGFTILEDPGHAAYVVELTLSRTEVGTGSVRPPTGRAAALPGGAYGSVGAGVVIPLPSGKSTLVPLQRTQLHLRMHKRGEDAVVWDGTGVTVRAAGTRKGADEAVAADLSQAVLRSYPAQPEGVVGVP